MTKSLALAAALLATTTLTSAAYAGGGVRVGFGFPLGSFVAHEHQNYTPTPRYERHCEKPQRAARHEERYEAPVHKVSRPAPKVEVAEDEPAPRKVKHAPKVEVAEETPAPRVVRVKAVKEPAPIQTAKLEDKNVISDAAPLIYVPEAPPASNFTGTQSTPAAFRTAALSPPAIKEEAKVETPKVEKIAKAAKDEPKVTAALPSGAKRLCRRFSAAIAGLIDIPCE